MNYDVFADIVNVLLFDGKEIVNPDELTDAAPKYGCIIMLYKLMKITVRLVNRSIYVQGYSH